VLNEDIVAALPKGVSPTVPSARTEFKVQRVELVVRCQELARFLRGVEENVWADWVEARINEISLGRIEGVAKLLDGFCGMCSIADVFLCPEAGHRVTAGDENSVNERYLVMLSKVNALARNVQALATPIRQHFG
jgi:hypothetical protein